MSVQEKGDFDITTSQEMVETTTTSTHGGGGAQTTNTNPSKHARSGSSLMPNGIPLDKVRLDVLLISGQRRFFIFDPSSSIKHVREKIWEDWPEDWPIKPASISSMRILHFGHILDDKTILYQSNIGQEQKTSIPGAIAPGKSTVVHLLIRQEPSKSTNDDESPKGKNKKAEVDEESHSSGCCCVIC